MRSIFYKIGYNIYKNYAELFLAWIFLGPLRRKSKIKKLFSSIIKSQQRNKSVSNLANDLTSYVAKRIWSYLVITLYVNVTLQPVINFNWVSDFQTSGNLFMLLNLNLLNITTCTYLSSMSSKRWDRKHFFFNFVFRARKRKYYYITNK